MFGILLCRPRLTGALVVGVVAGLACSRMAPLHLSTSFIVGWDVLCVVFMALMFASMWRHNTDDIRANAARDDEGRRLILALVLIAATVSVIAVAGELALARPAQGWLRAIHVSLAFGTVAVSWAMVQMIFALHYAHGFYSQAARGRDTGGLKFPGTAEPDYWDFVHFAAVIGVASQTADVAFTSRALRRVGTLHSVVAFAFNTLVLALTINLVAGLF